MGNVGMEMTIAIPLEVAFSTHSTLGEAVLRRR
jgi:hypothetical protein